MVSVGDWCWWLVLVIGCWWLVLVVGVGGWCWWLLLVLVIGVGGWCWYFCVGGWCWYLALVVGVGVAVAGLCSFCFEVAEEGPVRLVYLMDLCCGGGDGRMQGGRAIKCSMAQAMSRRLGRRRRRSREERGSIPWLGLVV